MQTGKRVRQCIMICLLLVMIIFIDCRTRLDANAQVLFCLHERIVQSTEENADYIMQMNKLVHENTYLLQEQMHRGELVTAQGRLWRSQISTRFESILGICILVLLFALSEQKSRKIRIYDNQYILQRYYHIIYIQDSDGRKKVSML